LPQNLIAFSLKTNPKTPQNPPSISEKPEFALNFMPVLWRAVFDFILDTIIASQAGLG
jgi:hypothetical protein